MVDIAKHIRTLLFDYSVVIVPDFGAFSTRYSPAKINREQNQVEPPRKEVYFNQALKINDNLLASHVAKAESITQEAGREHIKRFVMQCESTLRGGQPLNLDQIGVFSSDSTGTITFKADANSNFSKDAFGLTPVQNNTKAATQPATDSVPEPASEVQDTQPINGINGSTGSTINKREAPVEGGSKKTIADVLADNAKKIQSEEPAEEVAPIASDPQYPDDKPKRGIMGKLLWALPILALILGCSLAYQLWNNFNDNGVDSDWAQSMEGVRSETMDKTGSVFDGARDATSSLVEGTRDVVGSAVDKVAGEDGIIADAADGIGNAVDSGTKTVSNAAGKALSGVNKGASNASEAVKSTLSGSKSKSSAGTGHAALHSANSASVLRDKGHYVVLNVYSQEKNGLEFLRKNKNALRDARIYLDEKGMYKAAVYVGRDRSSAERTVSNLKRQGFARAWIYTK